MRKMFMRISLIACIGLVFTIGGMLSFFAAPIQNQVARASGGAVTHTLTVRSVDGDGNPVSLPSDELIRIRVVDPDITVKPDEIFGNITGRSVVSGSTISIIGGEDPVMEFIEFDMANSTIEGSQITPVDRLSFERRFVISGNSTIIMVFEEIGIPYAISISARNGGNDITDQLGNSVRVSLDGNDQLYNPNSIFRFAPMQTLDSITVGNIPGYEFSSFSIKLKTPVGDIRFEEFSPVRTEAGGTRHVFEQVLDTSFFAQYLSLSSEIIIEIEFARLYKLEVDFAGASETMGSVTLYKFKVSDPKGDRIPIAGTRQLLDHTVSNYFEADEDYEITATAKDSFHVFAGFDRDRNPSSNVQVRGLSDDKIITVNFRAKLYGMDSDLIAVGFAEAQMNGTREEFRVGQTLVFTYEVPANNKIKSWKIKNKAGVVVATIPKGDISASGVTLTLTGEMLTGNKFEFVHDVNQSLDDGLLAGIIVPGAVIPVLLIVLIIFMVMNAKRKKIIKAQLEGKRALKMKRDVGGYIADLRSGADTGKITKAQIKAEMKKQKGEKSDTKSSKPQVVQKAAPAPAATPKQPPPSMPKAAPAPAPAPAPKAAPAPAPEPDAPMAQVLRPSAAPATAPEPAPAPAPAPAVPRLAGTKMTADRNIVDGGGNVIASLQQDGSIADKSGKVFAKIRMTDGAIVGADDKVLGVVQGDGSIK